MTSKYKMCKFTLTSKIDGITMVQRYTSDQLVELEKDIAYCIANGYGFTFKVNK